MTRTLNRLAAIATTLLSLASGSAMAYTGELEVSAEGKLAQARTAARLAFETKASKAALQKARGHFADKPLFDCDIDEARLHCQIKQDYVSVEAVPVKTTEAEALALCTPPYADGTEKIAVTLQDSHKRFKLLWCTVSDTTLRTPAAAKLEESKLEEGPALFPLLSQIEAAMDHADSAVSRSLSNELRHEAARKQAKAELCPLTNSLALVTRWSGTVEQISRDYRDGHHFNIKLRIGTKFDAEIAVPNTPENAEYLIKLDVGSTLPFRAKVSQPTPDKYSKFTFCDHFTPGWNGQRFEKGRFFFDNLGVSNEGKDCYTARLVK